MGTSSLASSRALARVARRQCGCFTSAQAVESGYAYPLHVYHVERGGWIRLARGIYRLAGAAPSGETRLMTALLWPRNKAGAVDCALAGDAAEAVRAGKAASYDGPVLLAVPKGFRFRAPPPEGVEILVLPSDRVPSKAVGPFRVVLPGVDGEKTAKKAEKTKKTPEKPPKTAKIAQKPSKMAEKRPKTVEKQPENAFPETGDTQTRADWFDRWEYERTVEEIRDALDR